MEGASSIPEVLGVPEVLEGEEGASSIPEVLEGMEVEQIEEVDEVTMEECQLKELRECYEENTALTSLELNVHLRLES